MNLTPIKPGQHRVKRAAGVTLERLTGCTWLVDDQFVLMCDDSRWKLGMVTELRGAGYRTLDEAVQTLKDVFGVETDAALDVA